MLRAFNATSISGRYTGIGLHRRSVEQPGPDADVRADGVQLLPSGLRADEQGDHRREPGGPGDADRDRRVGRGLHELHPHLDARSTPPATSSTTTTPRWRSPTTPAALVERMNARLRAVSSPGRRSRPARRRQATQDRRRAALRARRTVATRRHELRRAVPGRRHAFFGSDPPSARQVCTTQRQRPTNARPPMRPPAPSARPRLPRRLPVDGVARLPDPEVKRERS